VKALPRPPIAPPGLWSFPHPQRDQLSNGMDVVTYRLPGQHVVSVHLIFDLPLSAEDRDREGVATICARTLDEGTVAHPGEEFAEELETEGAGFGIDVTLAGLQTIVDVPANHLGVALELLTEAVTEPQLAEADVRRHVQLRLAEIEQVRANSAQTANVTFRAAVFDPSSRASRMNGGEPDTVEDITPEVVRSFHTAGFGPQRATLIMAGDFADNPVALAERALGRWQNPHQALIAQPSVAPTDQKSILVDRPGAVQADIRLGGFGIDRLDPRWADITVASYAVGGAFLSRLNSVLREERGYTYGVRMQFSPLRTGGWYAVQGSFRTEVAVDALAEARQLLDIRNRPITTDEVEDAVNFFTGVTPLRYAAADGVADQAATQVLADLGDDYVDRSLAALRATTAETVTAAYQSIVDLDRLSLVVVGDAERLAGPLREAGYSDHLTVVDASGASGRALAEPAERPLQLP
jgi:zinc protease